MKKLCAGILSILLIFSLLPLAALGDETTTTTGSSSESSAPAADSKVTIVVSVLDKTAVVATVKDKDGKAPEGLSLKLTVDGVEKETKAVEKKTQVMFDYTVAVGDTEIVVSSDKQTVGDVTYAAARGSKTLEYTPEELLGFTFVEYERTFDGDTGRFYVRWNEEEAGSWTINRILVDGVGYRAESLGGNLTAALIDIPHGAHKLSYVFAAGDKTVTLPVEKLVRTGEVDTNVDVAVVNNKITATVTDFWGQPVAGMPVTLTMGNTTLMIVNTNSKGVAAFNVAPDGSVVTCAAGGFTSADGVIYRPSTGALGTSQSTTAGTTGNGTTGDKPATTARPITKKPTTTTAGPTTTAKTYATITGAGTTGVEGDDIVLDATFDTGVVDAFKLKKDDFLGKARFLLPKATYQDIVGDSNGILMMQVRSSAIQVTDAQISAAIANVSKFSLYHAENVKRVTVDISLLFNSGGKEATMSALPNANYTVQLPVPKDMKDIKLIAVAATNEAGISTPVVAKVENGYLRFDTHYLANFTILGFAEAEEQAVSRVPTLVIVAFVIAGVLLVGAGLLFYFFVLRGPKDDDDGELPPPDGGEGPDGGPGGNGPSSGAGGDTMEDIFSGAAMDKLHPPVPYTPPSQPDMEDLYSSDSRRPQPPAQQAPAQGVSLGSFQQRPQAGQNPPPKNPLDIDL